jgi:dTDP-4-amino-4,6-dideoxygalactose transaminase
MRYKVRFVKPDEAYQRIKSEIDSAVGDCLTNGDYILRHHLRDFEQRLAEYVGVKYAVGVNSGYHALHLSLLAAGIGPGDEVITVAHTFVATISAIVHCGARPVLLDVGKDYNMNVDHLEAAVTPRTKAIIPVHLNGRLADMDRVMEVAGKHRLKVIEDACQSLGGTFRGKRAGSIGTTGCFSFYPFKALGCYGDGGAVTTNDEEIARAVTLMRFNGEDRETGEYHYHGYTALLDNVQAAILDVKLKHFPVWTEQRRKIAQQFLKGLSGVGDLELPHYTDDRFNDGFQNYVIRTKRRDELRRHLTDNGIETLVHWFKPVWKHKALNLDACNLPETVRICQEVISLPMSAETTEEEVSITCDVIRGFFKGRCV